MKISSLMPGPNSKACSALTFPLVNPVAFKIGPLSVHWYGIAYCLAILCGAQLAKSCMHKMNAKFPISDFASNIGLGIILGGRLGYVLFYDLSFYMANPFDIFAVWKGGMSFHGGAFGAFIATLYSSYSFKMSKQIGLDLLALCATPGLFFGRLANFINGELYGRVSTLPWAMVFPNGGPLPRHPSQLYEAFAEGIGLFIFLWLVLRMWYQPGRLFFCFVIGYAVIRFFLEYTREPDAHIGRLAMELSMGQYLSLAMLFFGVIWAYASTKFSIS